MRIEAGKYYRTRGGQVFGPMVRDDDPHVVYPWRVSLTSEFFNWTEEGLWTTCREGPFDLVAEVYVSDTPPAPQANTTKTAKDELVEKAALAILTGHYANPSPMSSYGFAEIWLAAEHFVEARKK